MKIDKTDRSERIEPGAGGYTKRRAAPIAAPAPAVSASVLGIPEAEFTPRVRDAIMTLTHEVDRLRRDMEQARAKLDVMARTADQDMLLPILNRRAFVREIARFTAFAERYRTPSSVIYFDLDDFKKVNDAYGHDAGDTVLRHFSDLIASQIRDSDVFARLGGDEFGVILAHVTATQAARKAAALGKALQDHPPVIGRQRVTLSFSFGVHELRAGEAPDMAIRQADRAMYGQKRSQN